MFQKQIFQYSFIQQITQLEQHLICSLHLLNLLLMVWSLLTIQLLHFSSLLLNEEWLNELARNTFLSHHAQ